jgi:adenylate kinase
MRIALTGTPGTGKTTVSALLPYRVVDLDILVKEGLNLGMYPDRGCLDADMEGLELKLTEMDMDTEEVTILESHFSHYFADEAVVLRLAPSELKKRLITRGYSDTKIRENLEAEAVDVILVEAIEFCSQVSEIDTTAKSPQEVANLVIKAIRKDMRFEPGKVEWLEDFLDAR